MSEPRKPYDLTGAAHDYPDWAGPPRRTIVVCTHPRSGSTLLGEALYFAGGLGCPLEYFHRGFRPGLARRWGTTDLSSHVRAAHRRRTDPGGVFATKLFWYDVEEMVAELAPDRFAGFAGTAPEAVPAATYCEIAALLAPVLPNPHFVYLERRDSIRMAVSGLAAMQTGKWRALPEPGGRPTGADAAYDFGRIDSYVAFARYCQSHWRNFFAAIGAAPFALAYEEMARDFERSVGAVLAWLGSDAAVPPPRLTRQSGAANEAFVLRYLRDSAERSAAAGE
jgi:LPS sulfotransferase NodH